MFTATLAYSGADNLLSVLDTEGTAADFVYELRWQPLQGTARVITPVQRVVEGLICQLTQDGVYPLVLARYPLDDALAEAELSQPLEHVQLWGSIHQEQLLYAQATEGCEIDLREVLCHRYERQRALAAYALCNKQLADKYLREGGCNCS